MKHAQFGNTPHESKDWRLVYNADILICFQNKRRVAIALHLRMQLIGLRQTRTLLRQCVEATYN